MHSFAKRLCQSLFPHIVPSCLLGGEKRKSEKAQLCRGITHLVAMPGCLLDHLTKKNSLLLPLRKTVALSGLSSTRLIASWTKAASGGRWSRLSSGFAGDATARLGQGHRGVLEHAGVSNSDEQAGGDGKEGARRGRRWWGVGVGRGV